MDLDPVIPLVSQRFSSIGQPVLHDPVCILRSLVLMFGIGYHSVPMFCGCFC
jgi:hypothetical protein